MLVLGFSIMRDIPIPGLDQPVFFVSVGDIA